MLNKVFRNALVFVVLILFITSIISPVTFSQNSLSDRLNISKLNLGNTLYVGGSGPGNYSTIQSAIDAASSGDTVFVYNGLYYENILIHKTINLIGEDRVNTIIDGGGSGDVIYSMYNDLTIKEFTLQNGSKSAGYSMNCCIELYSENNIICDNIIKNSYNGIYLYGSDYNTIKNNTVQSCYNGINLYSSSDNIVNNNDVFNNELGFYLNQHSDSNIFLENNIFQNSNLGLYVYQSNDNEFYHNNFIDNANHVNVHNSFNIWDNGYPSGGNYWDDYTGSDFYNGVDQDITGSDGIGDISYPITGDVYPDNYPLMNPYGSVTNLDTGEIFIKIQDAIDDSDTLTGHTIYVKNGAYYENVIIDKTINLIGEDKNNAIIDGNGNDIVVKVLNDFVNISNFKIMHCGPDSGPGDDSGVFIHSNSTIIEDCVFQENECAIMMDFIINNNEVINCSLINNYLGIWVHGSNNVVDNNLIKDTGNMGIMLDYADNCTVENNEFINNAIGTRLISSNNNFVLNNSYLNNLYTAIQIHQSSTYQNYIIDNVFENNDIGIDIFSDSYNNYIYHNNFINNNINARDTSSNIWDNGYPSGGNYWDDYTGVDRYKGSGQDIYGYDYIGDTPYPITGDSNQDNYPFMYPYGEEPPIDSPPSVYLIYPTDGETLKDRITIKWNAHDSEDGTNIPIHFYLYDENDIFTIFEDNPYDNTGELQWDTTQFPDGEYRLLIETQDSGLNIGLDDVVITIKNHEDPIENNPPNKPTKPQGETSGKAGEEYNYTTTASDADDDLMWFKWDWGDGTYSDWEGPETSLSLVQSSHIWDEKDDYNIRVKAKDEHGEESEWSDPLTVTMPSIKLFNQIPKILVWLFEQFPFLQSYFSHYF